MVCLKILKIFSSSHNRVPLREELKLASTYNADFWERGSSTEHSDASHVPRFPFILTCLCLGAGFDPTSGYQDRVSVEAWPLEYDQEHNNQGEH